MIDIKVPAFEKTPGLADFFRRLIIILNGDLKARVPTLQGIDAAYLVAPNKSVWKVTVSNTGVLSTTQVSG